MDQQLHFLNPLPDNDVNKTKTTNTGVFHSVMCTFTPYAHEARDGQAKLTWVTGYMLKHWLFCRQSSSTRLRTCYICYVWSVLLYGCETWTISETMKERLRAVEMWFSIYLYSMWEDILSMWWVIRQFRGIFSSAIYKLRNCACSKLYSSHT